MLKFSISISTLHFAFHINSNTSTFIYFNLKGKFSYLWHGCVISVQLGDSLCKKSPSRTASSGHNVDFRSFANKWVTKPKLQCYRTILKKASFIIKELKKSEVALVSFCFFGGNNLEEQMHFNFFFKAHFTCLENMRITSSIIASSLLRNSSFAL